MFDDFPFLRILGWAGKALPYPFEELFLLIYNILHMESIEFANRWVRGCVDGMLR